MKNFCIFSVLFLSVSCFGMEGSGRAPVSDDEKWYTSEEEGSSDCESSEGSVTVKRSGINQAAQKKKQEAIKKLITLCNTEFAYMGGERKPEREISLSKSLLKSEAELYMEDSELQIRGNWRFGALPNGCLSILNIKENKGFIINEDPAIYDVAVNPDNKFVATATAGGIAFWRTFISEEEERLDKTQFYDGCLISRFTPEEQDVHTISWSPNGEHFYICYDGPSIEKFGVLRKEDTLELTSIFKTSLEELKSINE